MITARYMYSHTPTWQNLTTSEKWRAFFGDGHLWSTKDSARTCKSNCFSFERSLALKRVSNASKWQWTESKPIVEAHGKWCGRTMRRGHVQQVDECPADEEPCRPWAWRQIGELEMPAGVRIVRNGLDIDCLASTSSSQLRTLIFEFWGDSVNCQFIWSIWAFLNKPKPGSIILTTWVLQWLGPTLFV